MFSNKNKRIKATREVWLGFAIITKNKKKKKKIMKKGENIENQYLLF